MFMNQILKILTHIRAMIAGSLRFCLTVNMKKKCTIFLEQMFANICIVCVIATS